MKLYLDSNSKHAIDLLFTSKYKVSWFDYNTSRHFTLPIAYLEGNRHIYEL